MGMGALGKANLGVFAQKLTLEHIPPCRMTQHVMQFPVALAIRVKLSLPMLIEQIGVMKYDVCIMSLYLVNQNLQGIELEDIIGVDNLDVFPIGTSEAFIARD